MGRGGEGDRQIYGDIRDWLPMAFGLSVLLSPLLPGGLIAKVVNIWRPGTMGPEMAIDLGIGLGLMGTALGVIAELQRKKYGRKK